MWYINKKSRLLDNFRTSPTSLPYHQNIKYIPKQLNDNVWVAVEEGYETGANENNIYQFVGTAGTKEAVEGWIENYEIKGQGWVVYEENENFPPKRLKLFSTTKKAEEWIQENKDNFDGNLIYERGFDEGVNKGMFAHMRVWQDGDTFYVAEAQSDFFQKNKPKDILIKEKPQYYLTEEFSKKREEFFTKQGFTPNKLRERTPSTESLSDIKAVNLMYIYKYEELLSTVKNNTEYNDLMLAIKELEIKNKAIDEYTRGSINVFDFVKKYNNNQKEVDAFIKDEKLREQKHLENILSPQEKQFIASQKEWEKRLLREALKEASLSGATELRFPTPYTLSVIQGYVSPEKGEGETPYTIITANNNDRLEVGDIINYLNSDKIVYDVTDTSIKIVDTENDITEEIVEDIKTIEDEKAFTIDNILSDKNLLYKGVMLPNGKIIFTEMVDIPKNIGEDDLYTLFEEMQDCIATLESLSIIVFQPPLHNGERSARDRMGYFVKKNMLNPVYLRKSAFHAASIA